MSEPLLSRSREMSQGAIASSDSNELLLLGLLDRQRMHGYELHEFLEKRLGFLSDLKKPTAYRLLDKLHGDGLVDRQSERSGNRPERRVYSLTEKGKALFESLLREQLALPDRVSYPSSVSLLFADRLDVVERRELLRKRKLAFEAHRDTLSRILEFHPEGSGARLVLDHDLRHIDAEIGWLNETLNES